MSVSDQTEPVSSYPKRVLVVGGGPAGLAAAVHLKEQGRDRVEVDLVLLHDRLGGKASSWRDEEGYLIETGYHIFVGFYDRLRGLMERAGVDPADVVHPGGGMTHYYEAFSGRVHSISSRRNALAFVGQMIAYDGLPFWHRQSFNKLMAYAYLEAFTNPDLTVHDDVCFSTWAIERGLRPEIAQYSIFRFFREAYFNWPEEVSAYAILQTLHYMRSARTGEIFYPTAGMTENLWNPLGAYFTSLGGRIFPEIELVRFEHDGRRVSGVWVRSPRELPAPLGPRLERVVDGEMLLAGYDQVISAIPVASFQQLNQGDEQFWSLECFRRARNIRSATTLSLTAWTREPALGSYTTSITGLPAPLGIVADYKSHVAQWQQDTRFGSVLGFWGQENPFADWDDERLVDRAFVNFEQCLGFDDPRRTGLVHLDFHRNSSPSNQVFLCEPGINVFRPASRTPLENLWLCGDWVRNGVDLLCIEAAVDSGQKAAGEVVEACGIRPG